MSLSQERYVETFGLECPNCGSTEVYGWDLEDYGTSSANRPCNCGECNAEWVETYELTGYDSLMVPNENEEMIPV